MIRPPTRSKLMYTLVPDTTLLRSVGSVEDQRIPRLVEVATETAAAVDTGGEVFEGEDGEQGHTEGESDNVVWKTAACGGGFTVAVTDDGRVYSWGLWARGRLVSARFVDVFLQQVGEEDRKRTSLNSSQ